MTTVLRADHIGSLLRPAELLEARRDGAEYGRISEIEDKHILRVLAKQRELGFESLTDGELRRRNFMSDFTDAVSGFDLEDAVQRSWEGGESEEGKGSKKAGERNVSVSRVGGIVRSKLKKLHPLTAHELEFLEKNCAGAIKITLPSATQFPAIAFKRGITDKVYPDPSALLWDVAEVLRQEMEFLSRRGVSYIQIDAPRYSYYMDPKWRDWMQKEMGVDPEKALEDALRADNLCFKAARSSGAVLGIHLCRGNNRSHWYAQGGYDAIAEKLFSSLDVDRFLLEYDDERSGTFEPLRFVPRGKTVVLGLISSKRPKLENQEALLRQVEAASEYVPLENLALSPQCGFASTMEGNLLTEDEQWAKLRLVTETARRIWG